MRSAPRGTATSQLASGGVLSRAKQVGDDAPELGPVAFNFDQGVAKLGLLGSFGERLLEQTAEPVLLALNPKDVLNFLQSARARDVSAQKQTT